MTTTVYPPVIPPATRRIASMLARALDPDALAGESETSAVMAIRAARRQRMTVADLADAIAPERRLPPPEPEPVEPPEACFIEMPRGKFRGWRLAEIGRRDLRYLRRVASEYDDADLADAAQTVIDYLTGRGDQ